ncbi:hypothetical protein ACN079_24905 [Pseudomonas sp. ABY48]|uniref:hypothetical protein n=1 Tax=Pseudomonas sp. ABY48 TaxID=3402865 RepID=UPI003B42F3C9
MSVFAFGTRLAVASLYFLAMNVAVAAPTPGDTDLIRERQDRLLEEQRRRLEELNAESLLAVQEVCNGDSGEACERVRFTEGGKFGLSAVGGWAGGEIGKLASVPVCLALGVSTGIGGVVCVAALVGTGAWVGTTYGGKAGEYMGEKVYEVTQP